MSATAKPLVQAAGQSPPPSRAPSPAASQAQAQIVTFRLGGDLFAADIHGVERVLQWQEPTPVPNVPSWISGVIDYQKRVLPVLDLRARFEMPMSAPTNETRIVVFNAGDHWVAGIVDAVLDVARLDAAAVEPPPPLFRGLSAAYLKGIVRRDGKLVMLLHVSHLVSATERLALETATEALSHA